MIEMITSLRQCFKPHVGGLGSALRVGANSAAPKRGRCEEQLPCPKHHWSGAALPPTHLVFAFVA